jgi:hypothetical protein
VTGGSPQVGRGRVGRAWGIAALLWWGSILGLLPFGRGMVEWLRDHQGLVLGVTLALGVAVALLWGVLRAARRRGAITSVQAAAALALVGVVVGLLQLWPRAEERWHVVQYGTLGVLALLALRRRGVGWALLLPALAGWGDEAIQLLVPDRVYDWLDVALNVGAATAGVGGALVVERLGRSSHEEKRG